MELSILAIVEIFFLTKKLSVKDIQLIEKLLRGDKSVESLSVYGDRITFHILGKDKVDYKVLDQIKEELKKRKCSDFTISAVEYMKTANKYYYDANTTGKE